METISETPVRSTENVDINVATVFKHRTAFKVTPPPRLTAGDGAPAAAPIKVVFRMRPPVGARGPQCVCVDAAQPKATIGLLHGSTTKFFEFDYGFDEAADNNAVCAALGGEVISELLEGFNQTLMAFGQTGSGKTYTMEALTEHGLRKLFRDIEFEQRSQNPRHVMSYSVRVSYLELYKKCARDLLAPATAGAATSNLQIRGAADGSFYAHGLQSFPVASAEKALALFRRGAARRRTAGTAMNNTSSRSHAIFQVEVEMKKHKPLEGATTHCKAVLNFVDLAGSERQQKSQSTGEQMKEAQYINQSLSQLQLVVNMLLEGSGYVPFTSSSITRLLKESLGGNARTTVLICCSPDHANAAETESSLDFGRRLRRVQNKPIIVKTTLHQPGRRSPFGAGKDPTTRPPFGSTFNSPSSGSVASSDSGAGSSYHTPLPSSRPHSAGSGAPSPLAAQLEAVLRREADLAAQLQASKEHAADIADSLAHCRDRLAGVSSSVAAGLERERKLGQDKEKLMQQLALLTERLAAKAADVGALTEALGACEARAGTAEAERGTLKTGMDGAVALSAKLREQLSAAEQEREVARRELGQCMAEAAVREERIVAQERALAQVLELHAETAARVAGIARAHRESQAQLRVATRPE